MFFGRFFGRKPRTPVRNNTPSTNREASHKEWQSRMLKEAKFFNGNLYNKLELKRASGKNLNNLNISKLMFLHSVKIPGQNAYIFSHKNIQGIINSNNPRQELNKYLKSFNFTQAARRFPIYFGMTANGAFKYYYKNRSNMYLTIPRTAR
jgi:hypothetical protein